MQIASLVFYDGFGRQGRDEGGGPVLTHEAAAAAVAAASIGPTLSQ